MKDNRNEVKEVNQGDSSGRDTYQRNDEKRQIVMGVMYPWQQAEYDRLALAWGTLPDTTTGPQAVIFFFGTTKDLIALGRLNELEDGRIVPAEQQITPPGRIEFIPHATGTAFQAYEQALQMPTFARLEECYLRCQPHRRQKLMEVREAYADRRARYGQELLRMEREILLPRMTDRGGVLLVVRLEESDHPVAHRDVLNYLEDTHFPDTERMIEEKTTEAEIIDFLRKRERAPLERQFLKQRDLVQHFEFQLQTYDSFQDSLQGGSQGFWRNRLDDLRGELDNERRLDDEFRQRREEHRQQEWQDDLYRNGTRLINDIEVYTTKKGKNAKEVAGLVEGLRDINYRRLEVVRGQGQGDDTLDNLGEAEDRLLQEIEQYSIDQKRMQEAVGALREARGGWRQPPERHNQQRQEDEQLVERYEIARRERLLRFLGDHGLQVREEDLQAGEREQLGEALRLRVREHLEPQGALQSLEANERRREFRTFLAGYAEQLQGYLESDEYQEIQEYMQTEDYLGSYEYKEYQKLQDINKKRADERSEIWIRLEEERSNLEEISNNMRQVDEKTPQDIISGAQ